MTKSDAPKEIFASVAVMEPCFLTLAPSSAEASAVAPW